LDQGSRRASRLARLGRLFVDLTDTLVIDYDVFDSLYLVCERTAEVLAVDAVGLS
jgi:hypothetical protein